MRCFDNSEPPSKRMPKSRMVSDKLIYFVSQHKSLYDKKSAEYKELEYKYKYINMHFELLEIIPQLLDKEVELSFLSTQSQEFMDPIFPL